MIPNVRETDFDENGVLKDGEDTMGVSIGIRGKNGEVDGSGGKKSGIRMGSNKKRGRRRGVKVLRGARIGLLLLAMVVVVLSTIFVVNISSIRDARNVLSDVDNTFTLLESGISRVQSLASYFVIHDEASYQKALNAVDMIPSLKATLFGGGADGYHFRGTAVSADLAPTYEVIDVQYGYSPNSDVASYFLVVNVDYKTSERIFYVMCEMSDGILTSFHIY